MVNPFDFGGHSSEVKVMMGIDKYGVLRDATLCIVIFKKSNVGSEAFKNIKGYLDIASLYWIFKMKSQGKI